MTITDIVLISIEIIKTLISFGSLVIALLALLARDKDTKHKK